MRHIWSRSRKISGVKSVTSWFRTNGNKTSFHLGAYHLSQWKISESQTYGPGTGSRPAAATVPRLRQNEVVSRNVWLSDKYHSTPSLCRGCSPCQTHMELWVMSQAMTDRTGYTCLYAVYSTATHACSFFVFSPLLCPKKKKLSIVWICL